MDEKAVEIISQTGTKIGDVNVNFTVGRIKPKTVTRDDLLKRHYPNNIRRIRELSQPEYLKSEPDGRESAPNILASAFDWWATEEGLEHWNELYERGTDR
jgi:hypothetical protein